MLENILIKYFNLNENWNDDYDEEATNWYKSYDKLVHLLYDLGELGIFNEDINKIIGKLDKIDSENSSEDLNDFEQEIERKYDEWIQREENRSISYGEMAYIQGLSVEELKELENKIDEEMEEN